MFEKSLKSLDDRSFDVLLIGEILMDSIHNAEGHIFLTYGGSPSNIAINLTQLGFQTQLCAALGNDKAGNFLRNEMKKYQLNQDLIQTKDKKTSQVMLRDSKVLPLPVFKREADYHLDFTDRLRTSIKNSKIFHFSYWPLTKEPAKTTTLKALKYAQDNRLLIAFDPNIHEALQTDETINHGALMEMLKSVNIIKPSLDDATRLFGGGYDKTQYMDFFENFDIDLIMMTLGEQGVYVSYRKKRYHFNTKTVDVIDATGAGDAFWSGFYAGLLRGLPLEDTIALAQILSRRVLNTRGAIASLPPLNQIKKGYQANENTLFESSREL